MTRTKKNGAVRVGSRKLDDLKDHPSQHLFYGDSDHDASVRELANDIKLRGLQELIEIIPQNQAGLPTNTIISGHCRRDALKLLGETKADVVIRYDLAEADAATVEAEFLKPNQLRRHQSKLSLARVALRLYEIEQEREPGELLSWEHNEARDRVGDVVGMSGRNLVRYLHVLETPIEVQLAFEAQDLTLVMASRIAGLPPDAQQEIAEQIRRGASAKAVVEKYLGKGSNHPKTLTAAVSQYVRAAAKAVGLLDTKITEISCAPAPGDIETLRQASLLNKRLEKQLSANDQQAKEAMERLLHHCDS